MKPEQYWLVHCPEIGGAHRRHGSLKSAQDEARRLSRANTGKKFFVLEAVECVEKQEFVTTTFRSVPDRDQDIPF